MPKQSFDRFAQTVGAWSAPPTYETLVDLALETIDVSEDAVTEDVVAFMRGRIELAYRIDDVAGILRNLYDVLAVLERESGETR